MAPDLFFRGGNLRCMFSAIRQVVARKGDVFTGIETVRAWLSGRDDCTGGIGVVGFCFGGNVSLLLTGMGGYDASAVNYGGVPKDAPELLARACPIVGSYGARDIGLRRDPHRLREVLEALGIDHDVRISEGAGHSFMNDHADDEAPAWSLVMGGCRTPNITSRRRPMPEGGSSSSSTPI